MASIDREGILERLANGVVVGDGSFVMTLEKRGYVKAGPWVPVSTVKYPKAIKQLHREYLRAGSDVMQAFTYDGSSNWLGRDENLDVTFEDINTAACDLAQSVANEGEPKALVAGGMNGSRAFSDGKGQAEVKEEFRGQLEIFKKKGVDFIICEFFSHWQDTCWAIEASKEETNLPVAATMCIDSSGDLSGESPGECAVKLAKAGADIVGVNCKYDPDTCLKTIRLMKEGLDAAGLKPFLMTQPVAFHTPDAVPPRGMLGLPEYPFAMETRVLTRWEVLRYAREAYNIGVRYIGGCCGFEPYHIRAIAEELSEERGRLPKGSEMHDKDARGIACSLNPEVNARANRTYWDKLQPATGRLFSAPMAKLP